MQRRANPLVHLESLLPLLVKVLVEHISAILEWQSTCPEVRRLGQEIRSKAEGAVPVLAVHRGPAVLALP